MEFLRPKDVTKKMKIGKTFLYSLIKEQLFPRPIKVKQVSLWLDSDVEKVMTALYKGYDNETIKSIVQEIESGRLYTQRKKLTQLPHLD